MMNIEMPARRKRGKPQRRFMEVYEGGHAGVTEEDGRDRLR